VVRADAKATSPEERPLKVTSSAPPWLDAFAGMDRPCVLRNAIVSGMTSC